MNWIKRHEFLLTWIGAVFCFLTLVTHILIYWEIERDLNLVKHLKVKAPLHQKF
jgi:hypothetical protein